MAREINARIDALFVEGPDDGALVNALVNRLTGSTWRASRIGS
jgi:hypothetical protein